MRSRSSKLRSAICLVVLLTGCRDSISSDRGPASIEPGWTTRTVNIGTGVSPTFRVVNRDGRPAAGVRVYFESRSGQTDRAEATTDADGRASPGVWYPTFIGHNELTARAGSTKATVNAIGVCPSRPLALPPLSPPSDVRTEGKLEELDCEVDQDAYCPHCSRELVDMYSFTVTDERVISLRLTSSVPEGSYGGVTARLQDADGELWGEARAGGLGGGIRFIARRLPRGEYALDVRGIEAAYVLELLGCPLPELPLGTTTGALVPGDCSRGAPERTYIDRFLLRIENGLPVTITMASNEVDAYLELSLDYSFAHNPDPNAIVASSDNAIGTNARVTYRCPHDLGCIVQVTATSARPGMTGTYTLTVE